MPLRIRLRIAWTAAALMVAFGAFADANPQTPNPSASPLVSLQPNAPIGQTKINNRPNNNENTTVDWWTRVVGFLTLIAIGLQAGIYWRQARIMDNAIQAPRRPRFIVREMLQLPITTGDTLKIRCSIGNAGDAEGTIVESYVDVKSGTFEEWRPQRPNEGQNPIGSISIVPGAQTLWNIDTHVGAATLMQIANAEDAAEKQAKSMGTSIRFGPQPTIHLHGFIVYLDPHGIRHRTAFLRHLNVTSLRFYRGDDPDYEYAD
jgi:hypothetical protein